jgi:hypothetical protein
LLQDSVICSASGRRGGHSAAFKKRTLRPMGPSEDMLDAGNADAAVNRRVELINLGPV